MTMQDAFSTALRALEIDHKAPRLDARALQTLKTAVAVQGIGALDPSLRAKLRYRSHKLGRSWAAYTKSEKAAPGALRALQEEWTALTSQLVWAPHPQRVEILRAMVEGMGFGDTRNDVLKRTYLLREASSHPDKIHALREIPRVNWLSPAAYLLYAVAELGGYDADQRRQFALAVTAEIAAREEGGQASLTEVISAWLEEREHSHSVSPSAA